MSRRTAEAAKAIRLAWENEQKHVAEGKGTRDWTPDQQRDILESGKAHDVDGKAFEGQHMKSAAEYPEYQGDPENIQFLTHEEHLEAHRGSWQNSTNWYYDPVAKEFHDFGDGKYVPCEVIELSAPINTSNMRHLSEEKVSQEKQCIEKNDSSQKNGTDSKPAQTNSSSMPKRNSTLTTSFIDSEPYVFPGFHRVLNKWRNFESNHPIAAFVIKEIPNVALQAAETYVSIKALNSSRPSTANVNSTNKSSPVSTVPSKPADPLVNTDALAQNVSRALPKENDVSAHSQRYHYKDGSTRLVPKAPYHRGGK